ncbi:hypothetical protein PRABACTJOHN_03221 [Parabacteroides johnsonii DSM 18315]|uniref:Polysaccharide pyruvyl transferase domain-containing protein n=1 Tax=Parabacteroides johnsonii DSM 18315 TaxID=537006 RepID=B7BDU6_9BACT|nr:polysaccharide pyruvyl transferase family protein [Parabacteroides johnsonii]EEC95379.1 hypothetical protein PRABACTJOHN_03221 [Parabacteroides johnsonii DSM 18315]UEA89341.1 polysaccharide pyruvyl transferase family protein [Parabacteroides johnsonii]UWP41504.1 polysaccharide pyruvyl transferase family protein [Parabacteroides johnsonii DSM 18315]
MKIGTLTFHTAHNYGAMLQAYALVYYLRSQGHEAEIIDYQAEFNKKRFAPKSISHFLNLREIYNILFRNSYQKPCPQAFYDFYTNYLPKSRSSYTKEELTKVAAFYDKIVSGSDQVWNLACTDGDDSYFLPFAPYEKKYAYAASMGVSTIPKQLKICLTDYIKSFKGISVREHEAVSIVKELTGKDATLVVDPVLLLTQEQWEKIADYSRCPQKNYLLIYAMSEDMELLKFAKQYAKDYGLEIAYINQRLFKRIKAIHLRNVTPNQWLGLFLNATTIVTNSFHGSAFGINFGKNLFIKYIPRSIANSRLQTLVKDYSLESHLINSNTFSQESKLNLNEAAKTLERHRDLSYRYISEHLLS